MVEAMRKDTKQVNHDGLALNAAALAFYGPEIRLPITRHFFDNTIAKDIQD